MALSLPSLLRLASYLPSLLLYAFLLLLTLHYLLPFTLRTWFLPRQLRIGRFSLSAVHDLVYEPAAGSRFEGVRVKVGSIGFVRWRGGAGGEGKGGIKEGLRNAGRRMMRATDRDKARAWFLLRCQDVEISISKPALERILAGSSTSTSTSQHPHPPPPPPSAKRAQLPPHPPPNHHHHAAAVLLPPLSQRWQRLFVYIALQLSFTLRIEDVASVEGVVCAGAEIARRHNDEDADSSSSADAGGRRRRGRRENRGKDELREEEDVVKERGEGEREAKGWMRLSRIRITPSLRGSATSSDGADSPARAAAAAVEMLDPLVVRIAAPLIAVSAPDPPTPSYPAPEPPRSKGSDPDSGPTASSSSSSFPSPPPPPLPSHHSPRWALCRGGVRLAIEFGGEAGPAVADATSGGGDETLLVGLAAQASAKYAAAARKGEKSTLGKVARSVDAGVHVRLQELEAIVGSLKGIMEQAKWTTRRRRSGGGPSQRGDDDGEAKAPPREKKPSPLVFLDSISFELPSFLLTAQHTTPSAVISSSSSSPSAQSNLPKEIAFALLVRDVKAHVEINRSSEDVRKEHRDWFGRERQISWRIGAEWREIEGRVKLDGGEEDALRGGGKALSISASRIDLTSTWIPPFLAPHPDDSSDLFSLKQSPSRNIRQHHNDSIVLMEIFLGEIRGQALFETVDAAIRVFKARSRSKAKAATNFDEEHVEKGGVEHKVQPEEANDVGGKRGEEKERLIRGLPQLVGAAVTAGMELRIQAPRAHQATPSSSAASDSDDESTNPFVEAGDPTDPFFRSWAAPEILCLSFPSGQISFGGEYTDRSVRRSETDRRAAKRAAKQKRQSSAAGRSRTRSSNLTDEENEAARGRPERETPTSAFEQEFGVPPPPPLKNDYTKRRISPEKTPTNLAKDLDRYSLEYHARFSLTTDTLNAYILSSRNDRSGTATPQSDSSDSDSDSGLPRLPSDPLRFDILAIGPLEIQSKVSLLGSEEVTATHPYLDLSTCKGRHSFLLETAQFDLWRPVVMSCLRDLLASFSGASASSPKRSEEAVQPAATAEKKHRPFVDRLPPDQKVHLALASFDLRVAGTDPKADVHSCRGVAVHSGPLVLQYILPSAHEPMVTSDCASRSTLELAEDIHLEANALINAAGSDSPVDRPRIALIKVELSELEVDPVVDARASRGRKRHPSRSGDGHGEEASRGWETEGRAELAGVTDRRHNIIPSRFSAADESASEEEKQASRGLIMLPHLALRVRLQNAPQTEDTSGPIDEVMLHFETRSIELRLELFSIYLCLVAISSLRRLRTDAPPAKSPSEARGAASSRRPKPLITVRGECRDLHVWPTLPHDTHLFTNFRRLRLQQDPSHGLIVEWDKGMLAGQSPTLPGAWEDIVRLRGGKLRMRPDPQNQGYYPFVISLDCDTARLRIPFRYIFSRIIDNTASLVKATKQLIYEHVKGGHGFIIEPHPEEAKRLPQIELRVGLFAVELQDDPFETKLNIIWRAGAEEQASRLDREAAFAAKAEAVRKAEAGDAETSESETDGDDVHSSRRRPKVDARHSVGVEEARRNLLAYNSSSWIKRVRNASNEQSRREDALARKLYGSDDHTMRVRAQLPIQLAAVPKTAPLARATFHGLELIVSKPSFGENGLRDYLHDVGNGLPRDSTFSLLIPVHMSWKMEEARFQLRDYPLPLLHIPRGDAHQQYSWIAETDLVIAEETSGPESVRRVPCAVIPQHVFKGQGAPYTIVVPRSAMPTKTYMRPTITIRSRDPVRIGWGNSMQPAISDIARVLDTFTKSTPDPSPRIGFWDKIRLQFHWQLHFIFPGPRANVFFHLKGSRSPYALTGFGAGFAKAWKGNVQFRLGLPNPDHEFFQVISDEYVLGIPNLRAYVDTAATGSYFTDASADPSLADNQSAYAASTIADDQYDAATNASVDDDGVPDDGNDSLWVKICAKCSNGVRWGMGVVLERTCRDTDCQGSDCHQLSAARRRCRMFDFIPHWEVHTKTSEAIGPHGEIDDSFAGFRSDFIHFSLSLTSPCDLPLPNRPESQYEDEKAGNPNRKGYSSFHFTPVALLHFRRWWKLFDGCMSLPIRQGKLFPSAQLPSPKFGRHTATIKYRFALAPLFISHTYRQLDWEEWRNGECSVLGLKGKIGRFNVDLHQRAQEMVIHRPEMSQSKHVTHKVFYMAEVDLDSVDLRAIMAVFEEPEKAEFAPSQSSDEEDAAPKPDFDEFLVEQDEREWVNLDDFKDSVGNWPYAGEPRVHLLPFMLCPRFTYYRHSDAATPPTEDQRDSQTGDEHSPATPPELPKSKFGSEASHTCLMGSAEDTVLVQIRGAQFRLKDLESQLADTETGPRRDEIELRIRAIHRIIERLQEVRQSTQSDLDRNAATERQHARADASPSSMTADEDLGGGGSLPHITRALFEEWGGWENRYIIHSPLVHVSNATREVLLKYYYSSRERKGLVYYASASVLKFLRDMAQKHEGKPGRTSSRRKSTRGSSFLRPEKTAGLGQGAPDGRNDLLDELLDHINEGVAANEEQEEGEGERHRFGDHLLIDPDAAHDALPGAFDSSPKHLCMFIQPQISLQSNIDDKSNLIITAFRAQVKVNHVTDSRILDDPVNSDVLHQTFARLDGLQVFYPRTQLSQSARKRDRTFVPFETLIDLRVEPWGFDRVVPRSSAALRYDKFNQLRLSSKRNLREDSVGAGPKLESHFHTSTDRISFECQKVSVSANPEHFAAFFNVVTDLILYSDPRRKSDNARTEAVVFTRDFSHIREVLETVASLQERLRNHIYLEQEFSVHLDELDDQGTVELILSRIEFAKLAQELRVVVEAFTRAQDLQGKKPTTKRSGLQMEARAAELTWHMLDKDDLPFAKFSVLGADFSWISKQDGSATNRMVIRDLKALNSSPDQIFAEIVSKAENYGEDHPLAKVDVFGAAVWNSLNPVGGIAIIERFELHLHPIRLQLEHRVGRKILDYVFSERQQQRSSRVENGRRGAEDGGDNDDTSSIHSQRSRRIDSPASRSVESLPLYSAAQTSYRSAASGELLSSRASIRSHEDRLRRAVAPGSLTTESREEGLDADEMQRRAKTNRTFIFGEISSTVLSLTYRSEKEDKSSLPNIYNVTYTTPLICFRSKTWSYLDLLNDIKRDMIRSVWQQKGQLIGQFLSKTHRRLPMADTRSAAKQAVQASFRNRIKSMKARTGTGLVPPQDVALDAGIAPVAKDDDPLVRRSFRERIGAQIASNAPLDLPSPEEGASRTRDEDLPFDLSAVNLISPQVEYQDDDNSDEEQQHPATADGQARAPMTAQAPTIAMDAPIVEEPESLEDDVSAHDGRSEGSHSHDRISSSSSGIVDASSHKSSTTSSPRRTSFGSHSGPPRAAVPERMRLSSQASTRSTRSTNSTTSSIGSAGLPAPPPSHPSAARQGTMSLSDEQKARLILGRSLD
ncbi:hypothetical protein JCM10908_007112 [Rhodotorula pacifica]|uniref:uncharacterized protein n=1 Tax=Rhodotorula pacifica TaxID=1495444 RepID=UPI00317FE5FD